MNDVTNLSMTTPGVVNAKSETLLQLHALIESVGGLKKWSADTERASEELLAQLIFSETSGATEHGGAFSLAQDLPIPVIELVFEKHWPTFSEDRKGELISELMKLNSERSLTRHVAIARRMAQSDRQSAAHILQKVMVGAKRSGAEDFWPGLSKEKKELIRGRFGTHDWVYFNLPDERAMRSLLAGFVEALTESQPGRINKKTQRCLYDFSRWALSTLKRISIDESNRQLVMQRVMLITRDFPIEWKKELDAIKDVPITESSKAASEDLKTQETAPAIPTALAWDASRYESTTRSAVLALVERKRAEVDQRRSSIELLQNDVSWVEDEINLIQNLLREVETAELKSVELQRARSEIDGLKSTISQVELDLASSRSTLQSARDFSRELSIKNQELEKILETERSARTSERRELEEEAQRLIGIKLNGFKTRLAKSLHPIFDNKRNTDDQEPSSRLSEFLRSWFDEIEDQLNRVGIHLSKDL